jgi:hypothetical protein
MYYPAQQRGVTLLHCFGVSYNAIFGKTSAIVMAVSRLELGITPPRKLCRENFPSIRVNSLPERLYLTHHRENTSMQNACAIVFLLKLRLEPRSQFIMAKLYNTNQFVSASSSLCGFPPRDKCATL